MNAPYHPFMDRWHPDDYRFEEIQALKEAIRAKENRLVLSIPDIGLSNLMRFLVTRSDWGQRRVTFAYLDCDTLNYGPKQTQLSTHLFNEMAHQFHEQGLGDEPEVNIQGYERFQRYIKNVVGGQLDRLVVVVNKADRLLFRADEAFYRRLRALTDLNKRLCFIFATSEQIQIQSSTHYQFFAGRQLIVKPFNDRDLVGAIIEEGQRIEMTFDANDRTKLARLTGGHAGLLRAVTSVIREEKLDLSEEDTELVMKLIKGESVTSRCLRIMQVLERTQQAALRDIARGQSGLVKRDTLAWLQRFGLVNFIHGSYSVFSPILARYVIAEKGAATLERVTSADGKFFRRDEEISVRPKAQKLLAYFLTKPEQVLTYDEIAWHVWDTNIGVTNESISGLVRELRRALGSGYIKTHHSRGYEFINPP